MNRTGPVLLQLTAGGGPHSFGFTSPALPGGRNVNLGTRNTQVGCGRWDVRGSRPRSRRTPRYGVSPETDVPTVPDGLVTMPDFLAQTIIQALSFRVAAISLARPDAG